MNVTAAPPPCERVGRIGRSACSPLFPSPGLRRTLFEPDFDELSSSLSLRAAGRAEGRVEDEFPVLSFPSGLSLRVEDEFPVQDKSGAGLGKTLHFAAQRYTFSMIPAADNLGWMTQLFFWQHVAPFGSRKLHLYRGATVALRGWREVGVWRENAGLLNDEQTETGQP